MKTSIRATRAMMKFHLVPISIASCNPASSLSSKIWFDILVSFHCYSPCFMLRKNLDLQNFVHVLPHSRFSCFTLGSATNKTKTFSKFSRGNSLTSSSRFFFCFFNIDLCGKIDISQSWDFFSFTAVNRYSGYLFLFSFFRC